MSATAAVVRLLVSADLGADVFPIIFPPDATLPIITVSRIYEEQDIVLAGQREGYTARVSVTCHAATAAAVDRSGEAVKAALAVIEQTVSSADDPPVPFAVATIWKEGTDVCDFDDDRTVFRRIMDFTVRWVPA